MGPDSSVAVAVMNGRKSYPQVRFHRSGVECVNEPETLITTKDHMLLSGGVWSLMVGRYD
jgi:hypothetical protein